MRRYENILRALVESGALSGQARALLALDDATEGAGLLTAIGLIARRAQRRHRRDAGEVEDVAAVDAASRGPIQERECAAPPRLLLQCMIAAGSADGHGDGSSRGDFADAMDHAGLDEEERALLRDELRHPMSVDALARRVPDEASALEVYVAARIATDLQRSDGQGHLAGFGFRLDLSLPMIRALDTEIDVAANAAPPEQ